MANAFRAASIVIALGALVAMLVTRPAGTSPFREPGVWLLVGVLALAVPPLALPPDSLIVHLGIVASYPCAARALWLLLRPRKDLTSTAS